MFRNREAAALLLARRLKARPLCRPLVLAIPRGGVPLGAILARELGADLDVVLARKLRAPGQPELALGAVAETGEVYLTDFTRESLAELGPYLADERAYQAGEIERRRRLFRGGRPPAPVAGRSVIVTDDGIATGSTMLAALDVVRAGKPRDLLVAVPVISPDRVEVVRRHCGRLEFLLCPTPFHAIGQFYQDFTQVPDEQVARLLRRHAAAPPPGGRPEARQEVSS
jgi:predicted phosphoribosyltransferase